MAGIFQAGDIINFARLAWKVYELGWKDELNATKQYHDFFCDVKSLHGNLLVLEQVVTQARASLRSQGAYKTPVRWDPNSLRDILGDFEATLRECEHLIRSNKRYGGASVNPISGPIRNIEWNLLLQPTADRLRKRLILHNSKVLLVLKPFEIDLLCRVRGDIQRMHNDLSQRIIAMHHDLRHLMGVVIPDLDRALDQQEICPFFLEVPVHISEQFHKAIALEPHRGTLAELADALVVHYDHSTATFESRMLVADRTPPVKQYVNLLKCIWLLSRIKESEELAKQDTMSHWPSYVLYLEEMLSNECQRFTSDLLQPDVYCQDAGPEVFAIWPQRGLPALVDVVTRDEMMEQILELPLESEFNIHRTAKLFRRMDAGTKRFRIMISGVERGSSNPRQQTEMINFDVSETVINPQYALPESYGRVKELVLHGDERIARLLFTTTDHVLKFQQAITGWKAYAGYSTYGVDVSFVVGGASKAVVEKACLQLWIPKTMSGSLVTKGHAEAEVEADTGAVSPAIIEVPLCQLRRPGSPDSFQTALSRLAQSPPLTPASTLSVTNRTRTMSTSLTSTRRPSILSNGSSNSSDTRTILSTGTSANGVLHSRPPKPLLVLFTENQRDGKLSIVTISVDEMTNVNPERCHCRKAGTEGRLCPIVSIEKSKGEADIEAWRYESSREGWSIAPLAIMSGERSDKQKWSSLKRLSLRFPDPKDRARFGGMPNDCSCKIRVQADLKACLQRGHRGLWGEIQEFYRKQGVDYHRGRYEGQKSVVYGTLA